MKRLTINPSNKPYYSEDFIKGFEYGTQRQLEADLADRPRGELKYMGTYYKCSVCGSEFMDEITFMGELNYCPACGADMRGAEDDSDNI